MSIKGAKLGECLGIVILVVCIPVVLSNCCKMLLAMLIDQEELQVLLVTRDILLDLSIRYARLKC